MYKYLRPMIDLADRLGTVDDIVVSEWNYAHGTMWISGETSDGERFNLTLKMEDN